MINSRRLLHASRRAALHSRHRQGSICCLAQGPKSSLGLSHAKSLRERRPPFRCLSSSPSASAETKETEDAAAAEPETPPPPPVEKLEFQAETRQLLDIVTHSLYTDKEVFLRELVSNASDSLEKLRHLQATNQVPDSADDVPLEIRIELDEVTSSITITDTGIGMRKDELIDNLGTIAKSGSKSFLEEFKKSQEIGVDPSRGIIGKFGVGFYSSFMIAENVVVRSRSALASPEEAPTMWKSDGGGSFEVSDIPEGVRQDRGSSIQIFLKEEYWDFVDENRIEKILKRYSNFVGFPIFLNGKRVNTLMAIWTSDPKEVTDEEYTSFYKYIANAVDDPLDVYHFRADAPIDVKALFFIPSFHSEKYGMERMQPGVSLYSRKVLIESKSPDILPDWMRFVKGVVDSEDLPLAISREKAQDTALIRKLRRTLTQKFIAHLDKMAKKEQDRYNGEFYKEYAFFLKEGICQDHEFQAKLAKLLRFESSKKLEEAKGTTMDDELVSLDVYISRMQPEQKDIFYLVAPTRTSALNSPYLEAFEKAGVEVLLLYSSIDDFVMANLETYEGRNLVSVEKGDIDLNKFSKDKKDKKAGGDDADDNDEDELYRADRKLSKQEILDFCKWFKDTLGEQKVASCTATDRLTSSPAIVTDNESGAMRRMMYMVDTSEGSRDGVPLPKQHVEINSKHPIIVGINDLIKTEPTLARVLADQVYDNCLVAAGLLDDSRSMLPRLNDILLCVVKGANQNSGPAGGGSAGSVANDEEISKEENSGPSPPEPVVAEVVDKSPETPFTEAETVAEAEIVGTSKSEGKKK